jgi:hypothetical protein
MRAGQKSDDFKKLNFLLDESESLFDGFLTVQAAVFISSLCSDHLKSQLSGSLHISQNSSAIMIKLRRMPIGITMGTVKIKKRRFKIRFIARLYSLVAPILTATARAMTAARAGIFAGSLVTSAACAQEHRAHHL